MWNLLTKKNVIKANI